MKISLRRVAATLVASPLAIALVASSAAATNNCVFTTTTKSMILTASCSTDATILIPNGVTLDGKGFKITAIDPPGGNFTGAILRNAGKVANVTNLFLRTNLADVCNADADKVIGILMDKAAGTISSVNIQINKGAGLSTCAEGVAVQAQVLPYSSKTTYQKVTVKTSTLNYNQFAGIVALGNVSLRAEANLIKNLETLPIGQRGIEAAFGVKAYILNNQLLRHRRIPADANDPGYGILLNSVGQSTVLTNTFSFDDIGIRVSGSQKVTVKGNNIRSSTTDGILVDDGNGLAATGNTIWANDSGKNGTNGISLKSVNGLVTKNIVKSNLTERNLQSGIRAEGTLNKIQVNTAGLNTLFDIENAGAGNLYSKNVCTKSTGAPVDCPAVP